MRYALVLLMVALVGCDDTPSAGDDAEPPTPDVGSEDGEAPQPDPEPDAEPEPEADAGPDPDPDAEPGGCATEADPQWQVRASVGTGPIQEVAVAALGDEIYVVGGFDGGGRIVPRVSIYDPAADAWRAGTPLPVAMHHANAVAADGRLWVLGFLRDRAFSEDGRAFVYDPVTEAWDAGPDLPDGWHRGASGMAAIDGVIYVVAGFAAGSAISAVHAYDIAAETWSQLPDLPGPPRDHMAAGAVDGLLVVAGGRDSRIGAHVTRVDLYDPATGAWRQGADMPTSRGGMAAAAGEGRFYVIGGEGDRDRPTGVFPQVEVYDVACDAWRSLGDMPLPVHGTGAAVVDGWLYVPGGADVQAFGAIDQHARLQIR